MRRTRSPRRSPGSRRRTKPGTWRLASRISASILSREPEFRPRLADAIRRRHDALRHTAGLNAEVFDALLLMAAGSWEHAALRDGYRRLLQLTRDMDEGRRKRLMRLGFTEAEAAELSALHTRNFM